MELEQAELVLYHTDVDGRLVRIFLPVLFGAFAAGGLWLLLLWMTALPSATASVVVVGLLLWPGTLLFSWLAMRLAVVGWRSGRGHWWLRLSSKGFEVNDRIFAARRHEWREIDRFMLVAASTQGGIVGFVYSPGHRRGFTHMLCRGLRGSDGTRADGLVMGFWDRPFDEAVDLMNSWLWRYRAT